MNECAVQVCGFVFKQERVVYADWLTWAGLAVIAYTIFMLAVVNWRAHWRRVTQSDGR